MIKATRNWAPSDEQGRAFGILEGGRGIAEVASSTALLAIFARLGSERLALSWVTIIFSIIDILMGIMAWFTLKDSTREETKLKKQKIGLNQIIMVLKMPVVWLVSMVILGAYCAYWGAYYFTPYATDVFLMSVVFGGAIGVGKMWLKPVVAVAAGFLADRVGVSKTTSWSFLILILSFSIFIFTPGNPRLVFILVANAALASFAIFALRGIYYALLEEGGIPFMVTGTATGIISVIGYTPDVFIPLLGGVLLDKFPGSLGYRYLFSFVVMMNISGLVSALTIMHKKIKNL